MFCTPVSDSSQGILQYTGENFPTLNCIPLPEFPQHDKAPFPQFLSYCVALCAFPIPNCADSLALAAGMWRHFPPVKREGGKKRRIEVARLGPPSKTLVLQHAFTAFSDCALPPPTKREKGRMYLGWD